MFTMEMLSTIIRQDGETKASADLRAERWFGPVHDAIIFADLTTKHRLGMFLATVCQESGGLRHVVENLNYSAQGLANTWPTRYAKDPKAAVKVPNALAHRLHRKPEAIANNVYANRMGNGFEASGDGWKFRGRGPGQITGKANFIRTGDDLELDLVKQPELLEQPVVGMLSVASHWKRDNLNKTADTGNFKAVTKIWNGGYIGYDDFDRSDKDTRMDYLVVAYKVLPDEIRL